MQLPWLLTFLIPSRKEQGLVRQLVYGCQKCLNTLKVLSSAFWLLIVWAPNEGPTCWPSTGIKVRPYGPLNQTLVHIPNYVYGNLTVLQETL